MAGIGFELKKLFAHKGLIMNLRANLYASIVIAGPMIMGALLLFGLKYLSSEAGATDREQDILIVIVTYSILFPLLLTSLLMFVLNRYVADMLYEDKKERVLPSMYGAITLCLSLGAALWFIYLFFSGAPFEYCFFSFMLFCEAVVVWIQLSYTSAAKDYVSAVVGFVLGVSIGLLTGYLLIWVLHLDIVLSLLASACLAYGIMLITYTLVLHKYFPIGKGSAFKFLEWVEKYPSLVLIGFFTTAGLFIHLMLMWFSPWRAQAIGLFYHAPSHDIPALLAFFTTLVTTVRFVTAVEVTFYPKYRLYYSLLNGAGSLSDIDKAKQEMVVTLKQELFYMAQIQMFVEIIAIAIAGGVIPRLGLSFTPVMIGLFRVLCVGYGLFASGNSIVLFLLYLSDYRDAVWASFTLLFVNIVGTLYTLTLPPFYYGFGFLAASLAMYIVAWWRLSVYIKHLDYNVFSKPPIFTTKQNGWLTKIVKRLEVSGR